MSEPKQCCMNCAYFDGGAIAKHGEPIGFLGHCQSGMAPYTQTVQTAFCSFFYPAIWQWPTNDHD